MERVKNKQYTATIIIVFVTLFLFGMIENIKGISFPLIKTEFGTNYDAQGGLAAFSWFGYVIFCFTATIVIQKLGMKKALLSGYALVICGILATLFAPNFIMATISIWIINTGFGFFEVSTNAMASVSFTKKTALMLSLMHFSYGLGSIISPIFSGIAISNLDISWRMLYIVMIVPVAVMLIYTAKTKTSTAIEKPEDAKHKVKLNFASTLKLPLVLLFCITLGFCEVVEFAAANWGNFYLADYLKLDVATTGAMFVSVFYGAFTLSRLIMGPVIEKVGYFKTFLISLVALIALYIIGFSLQTNGIWALCATGFFIGMHWPTAMSIAFKIYKERSPLVTSVIITVSGAINGIFQLITGVINERTNALIGYGMNIIYCVVIIVGLLVILKQSKSPKVQEELLRLGVEEEG